VAQLPRLPQIIKLPSYKQIAEPYIETIRELDTHYVSILIDVSRVHRVVELEACGLHYSLGAGRQRFAGCTRRNTQTRGEFCFSFPMVGFDITFPLLFLLLKALDFTKNK